MMINQCVFVLQTQVFLSLTCGQKGALIEVYYFEKENVYESIS